MKILSLIFAGLAFAQPPQTRQVVLSWVPPPGTGLTGYVISAAIGSGFATQIGCVGTVPGSTCVNGSTASTTTYTDTQTVGNTVTYSVAAVSAPCTPTTPVTQFCGTGLPATAVTTIPPKPGQVTTIVVSIQ